MKQERLSEAIPQLLFALVRVSRAVLCVGACITSPPHRDYQINLVWILYGHCRCSGRVHCCLSILKVKDMKKIIALSLSALALTACTRIETGTVGLRVNMSNVVEPTELQPGSWNQTMFGSVLEFPVRSIQVSKDNMTPQTADNSTLKDFDVAMVYDINPTSVSDIWVNQSRAFHTYDHGEWYLMHNYMLQLLNSASVKAVRKYKALEVADNRQNIENAIKDSVDQMLSDEKLDKTIVVSQIRVANATPADDIVASANAAVKATNDLKTKQVEVDIAKQEALRIQTLNSNSQAIPYMNAMAQMEIAKAVREGKVQTIVIPSDFKGMLNVGNNVRLQ